MPNIGQANENKETDKLLESELTKPNQESRPGLGVEAETGFEADKERRLEPGEIQRETGEQPTYVSPQTTARPAPVPSVAQKSPEVVAVEKILEANLQSVYSRMTPEQQLRFRQTGEATASKIVELMRAVKVKVGEVAKLIIKWLRLIPSVNQYFLEQEAKIKTDKILALKTRR